MIRYELASTAICQLCETRRPRRACPGVGGDICSVCCGTEREVTVTCPLDCPYLQDAHRHEKLPELDPDQMPNRDIDLTGQFVDEHQPLINYTSFSLLDAVLNTPGTVDSDLREALESLIKTYRTRESGLYYETRPANLLAAALHQRMQQGFEDYRRRLRERTGVAALRDAEILGALVFWQRMAVLHNNGRRLSRSFLGLLREALADAGLSRGPGGWQARGQSPLVLP